jgi:folylpolyglutamate synthase/dihydropteroate synthase
VVLDVCHNPGGAAAFATTFAQVFPGRKAKLLLGLVKRKQHQEIIDILSPVTELFWLVPMKTKRSTDVKTLQQELDWHGIPVRRSAGLDTARRGLLKLSAPDDIIAVAGSHYLVGEYLSKYQK